MTPESHPPRRSFVIGRWQPLHDGHRALIQKLLDDDREVVVAIMDTPKSARNPYSVGSRQQMFAEAFEEEMASGQLRVVVIPWIDEVCFGRNCGWGTRRVVLSPELEAITATRIREEEARQ